MGGSSLAVGLSLASGPSNRMGGCWVPAALTSGARSTDLGSTSRQTSEDCASSRGSVGFHFLRPIRIHPTMELNGMSNHHGRLDCKLCPGVWLPGQGDRRFTRDLLSPRPSILEGVGNALVVGCGIWASGAASSNRLNRDRLDDSSFLIPVKQRGSREPLSQSSRSFRDLVISSTLDLGIGVPGGGSIRGCMELGLASPNATRGK